MAFSYEEWKKRDNQRVKATTSTMPSFEDWNGTHSKAQLISKGLGEATYENHAARQLAKAIERTPGERGRAANTKALLEDNKKISTQQKQPEKNGKTEKIGKTEATEKKEKKKTFWESIVDGWNAAKKDTTENLPNDSLLAGTLVHGNKNDTLQAKVGTNLRAGTGDFISQVGGALDYLGMDAVGKGVSDFGKNIAEGYGESYKNGKEFTWNNLLDPEFYATNVSRQIPQLGTMFIGGGVGLGIRGATAMTKLPTIAKTIAGVAGGTAAMTTLESAMEAGSVYEEAKNRGLDEKAAKDAADETFKKNLALTGSTSALELTLAMTPLTKGLSKIGIGKMGQLGAATAGGALTEGVQEGLQNKISTEALGDEFKWTDPNTVEAMVIGGLLGGAGTGGMSLFQAENAHATGNPTETQNNSPSNSTLDDITQRTINSLPQERRSEFDELVDTARQGGKSFKEAQLEALEEMASKYEDVQESTGQSAREYMIDKELERQSGSLNGVSAMERNLKEQEERNTLDYTFADQSPSYQFNPLAIAEKGQSLELPGIRQASLQQPNVGQEQVVSPLQLLQQALVQNNQTVPTQDVAATTATPLQSEQIQPLPQQVINENPNINTPETARSVNAPTLEQDNLQTNESTSKQSRELFENLEVGDEIKLKGTRADTTYTVVKDDGGKHVQVTTPNGRTIKVARNAIENVKMSRSAASALADHIEDIPDEMDLQIDNSVPQPEQTESANHVTSNQEGVKEQSAKADELFADVVRYVSEKGDVSPSSLQQRFKIDHSRASSLIGMLEQQGLVAKQGGQQPYKSLITEADLEALPDSSSKIVREDNSTQINDIQSEEIKSDEIKSVRNEDNAFENKDDTVRDIDTPSNEKLDSVQGDSGKTYTEAGTEIQFRYEVVDASQLTASHDTALSINPDYPAELQPRDRSRQASKQQVTTMAQKLNPELVAESAKASDGAPIVSEDYTVESGNGRTIAIQKMYQESYGTANDYKSYLVEHAEKYGLDKTSIEQMEQPVLVRVRTNEVNRQSFVEEANVSNVASMSATEQAIADAKKLTNKVMYLFSPSENGDLNVASNRAFISQFIQSVVPQNERGSLMTADGNLSQDGLRRVQNAILAKAYGNNDALLLMIESNDNNVKTLTNAMLQAAPTIANMKESIDAGAYFPEDISHDFVAAVEKFSELRKEGVTVENFLNQASLFDDGLSNVSKEFLQLFDKGVVIEGKARRSTKAYKSLLEAYADVLQSAGNPNQISLFEGEAPTKDGLFEAAIKKVSAETDEVQTDLFNDESSSNEPSGRSTQSSNTETFVRAREGKRKEDRVTPGETTRVEILKYIKDKFQVRLDVGQFRQKAKGIYKNKFSIIRTKDYGDFEVIAHEIGHRFDIRHGWSSDPELKQEWIRFAEANLEIPESMTPLQKAKEGVAEYFRQYLYAETEANVDYQELSDQLHQKVAEGLEKSKWSKPLESLQAKMLDWMNRDAEQELRGVVSSIGDGKNKRLTPKQFITKWYARVFEKEHPIYNALKQIEKETGLKFEGRNNAYEMAVLTRGTVARAATFIKRETFNSVTGERTGESLESILKDVDDVESFGRYLVARHGLYLIEKKGKTKTPLSPDLMKQYLESGSRYEAQAERIYQYQHDLLQVLVDGHLIPEELPGKLKEAYPYYVPFYRVMTETGEKGKGGSGGGSSQQFTNQQQGIKRMTETGSARNIVNPIESIIRNTHLYFGLADRNAVGHAMGELANPDSEFAAEVTRDIIEEIPSKMKLYEGQIKQIQKSLLDAGLEADMLEDLDMEQTFKVFEPMFKPSDANNEILVWKEGKPRLYKVHDDILYNSLIAYDNRAISEAMGIFFKPFEKSNNLIRSGITASPYFTVRTFWRSLAQILVKTEATGFNYVTHPARVAKAWGSVLKSVFSDVNSKIPESKAVSEWWKSGGAQSTFISVEQQYLNKELDKIALNKKAWHYLKSMKQGTRKERLALNWYIAKSTVSLPFKVLQTFNDTLDQALKLAEYQVVKKQTGSKQKAALASREADVDYKRFGSGVREFNKITLFFNVSLQGPDNIARTFAKHPTRTSIRALTLVTLPTLLLYAMNRDDEEYQELDSWEKDMNWMIPMGGGEFVKIPIPFELGVLFKTIPEKLFGEFLDSSKGEDKQSWDKIYGNALSTMTPSFLPTLATVWYSYVFEKNANFKRDFVPMSLQKLQKPDQYNENTSEIMKFLGRKLNKSPMTLEETFKAQFGQMGQGYLWGLDKLLITAGVVEKPDTKGLKRSYTERYLTSSVNDGGTNSITQFYEELDEKERDYASNGIRYSPPEDLKLYRKVQDDMKTLRKLRDAMMYDRLKDTDGQSFSKEVKKDHIDTINTALRDMARIARAQGDKSNKSEEAIMKDLDKAVLNKDNLDKAIIMLEDYEKYLKAVEKEQRKEAKKLQREL
ncbi:LPD38 domain-containing protein [Lysinibacillus sp. BSL11]